MQRPPILPGLLLGAVAYLIGIVLTALVRIGQYVVGVHPHYFFDTLVFSWWDFTGWLFYSAHFVGMSSEESLLFGSHYPILRFQPADPVVLSYFLIPVGTLIIAGYALNYFALSQKTSATQAVITGATICLGYGVLALVGVVLIDIQVRPIGNGVTDVLRPDVGYTLLYMGVVYPMILGGVGGLLADRWKRYQTPLTKRSSV